MKYNKKKTSKNFYFDEWEFNNLIELSSKDPETAINLYEQYIEKFPNDYSVLSWYSSTLITLSRYEEAESIIKKIEDIYVNDNSFLSYEDRVLKLKVNIIYAKIKLLMYKEEYKEAYELAIDNYDLMTENNYEINRVCFLCKKKLGMLNANNRMPNSYLFRQIVWYENVDFLYHVSKRHIDLYDEDGCKNELLFNSSFPLEAIALEIKKYLPSSKGMHFGWIEDTYIFKYNNCGKFENKNTDYFRVITLINSNVLITMYPYEENKVLPYVDLNYLKEDIPKQKRKSQVDKFNEKYKNY